MPVYIAVTIENVAYPVVLKCGMQDIVLFRPGQYIAVRVSERVRDALTYVIQNAHSVREFAGTQCVPIVAQLTSSDGNLGHVTFRIAEPQDYGNQLPAPVFTG